MTIKILTCGWHEPPKESESAFSRDHFGFGIYIEMSAAQMSEHSKTEANRERLKSLAMNCCASAIHDNKKAEIPSSLLGVLYVQTKVSKELAQLEYVAKIIPDNVGRSILHELEIYAGIKTRDKWLAEKAGVEIDEWMELKRKPGRKGTVGVRN